MGPWGSAFAFAFWFPRRGGNIAGDAAVVGDPAKVKLEEERRESARGEEGPTERSEAADARFCRAGMDLRRSSRRELELGVRRGVDWLGTGERDAASLGERRAGVVGRGVAVAYASERRFKESVRSLSLCMVAKSRGSIDRGGASSGLGSMMKDHRERVAAGRVKSVQYGSGAAVQQ